MHFVPCTFRSGCMLENLWTQVGFNLFLTKPMAKKMYMYIQEHLYDHGMWLHIYVDGILSQMQSISFM